MRERLGSVPLDRGELVRVGRLTMTPKRGGENAYIKALGRKRGSFS